MYLRGVINKVTNPDPRIPCWEPSWGESVDLEIDVEAWGRHPSAELLDLVSPSSKEVGGTI